MLKSKKTKKKTIRSSTKFGLLPLDIIRFIALYLRSCIIVRLCRLSKRFHNSICENDKFLNALYRQRLTEQPGRPFPNNIFATLGKTNSLGAAKKGYDKRLKYIIEVRGYTYPKDKVKLDNMAKQASIRGYLDILKYLESKGLDLHSDNDSFFRLAAEYGHMDLVEYLVSKAANIHAKDDFALRKAAFGNLEMVKYLVEHGANIHIYNEIPLRDAALNGYLGVVKYLVSQGADIHIDNDTIILTASGNGWKNILGYLLNFKYPQEIYKEIIKRVIQKGYKEFIIFISENYPEVIENIDYPPLFTVIKSEQIDILKFLIDFLKKRDRLNPFSLGRFLNMAVREGNLEMVKYLISEGADVHWNNDKSLRDARNNGYDDIVKYLLSLKDSQK